MEVANAEAYSSALDSLAKSGFSSIYNRRRGMQERQKLQSLPEVVTVLPPALRCLVFLWEQLCSRSVEIVQSADEFNTTDHETTPLRPPRNRNEHIFEDLSKVESNAATKRTTQKETDRELANYCELCDLLLAIPVTYHMRAVHAGCGMSSKGKGYNSVGTYCNGWAGNCGEGGKGATSWYLLCEMCRGNYIAQQKKLLSGSSQQADTAYGLRAMRRINMDAFKNMKENALFLLELSNVDPEMQLQQLNGKRGSVNKVQPHSQEVLQTRESYAGTSYGSNENKARGATSRTRGGVERKAIQKFPVTDEGLYWNVPETFNCMQSLLTTTRTSGDITATAVRQFNEYRYQLCGG